MNIVLVCGGRNFTDRAVVFETLDSMAAWHARMHKPLAIIHGGAPGADTLAGAWAATRGFCHIVVPAGWEYYGNRAGSVRNQWMIDVVKVCRVVAFPGGTGTADMVRRARNAGIEVVEVR